VDYILRRTGIDKYTCELCAPQPFQPFQLFHGALEQAHLTICGQFCAPALQVRPDCAPKILLKTALLCSLAASDFKILSSGTSEWDLLIRESLLNANIRSTHLELF
jgi:hypothetical protein